MIKKLISKNLITTIIVAFFCFFCLTSSSQLIAEGPEQTSKTLGLYCLGTSVYNADGILQQNFSTDAEGNILDTSGKVILVEPETEKDQEKSEASRNKNTTSSEMTTPTATSASPSSTSTNTASATNTSAVNSTPTVKPQTPAGTVTNNTSNTINTNNCASGSAAQPSAFTHNHEYIPTEVIAPTTTNYGYTLYTCKTCGDQQRDNYQEPIQCTHEHAVKTDVKPSCTVSGCTLIDCPDCGAATQSDITPATGHIWNDGEIIQAPTCAATGSIKYTCTKCGEIRISSVPATGHSYTDEIVEPTCEQVGYVVHTCSTCGTSNTEHTCGELGHDITFTVISPTATEQGYTLYECRRCGATVTGDYTSPTGTVSAGQQCGNNQAGTQQQPISAQPTLPQTHDYAAVVATGNSWLASNGYTVGGTDSFCPDIRYMRTKDSQGALESTMISVCINSVNAAKKTIASDPAISDAMFHCDCYQDGDTVVLSCWHSFVAAPDIELVFW